MWAIERKSFHRQIALDARYRPPYNFGLAGYPLGARPPQPNFENTSPIFFLSIDFPKNFTIDRQSTPLPSLKTLKNYDGQKSINLGLNILVSKILIPFISTYVRHRTEVFSLLNRPPDPLSTYRNTFWNFGSPWGGTPPNRIFIKFDPAIFSVDRFFFNFSGRWDIDPSTFAKNFVKIWRPEFEKFGYEYLIR